MINFLRDNHHAIIIENSHDESKKEKFILDSFSHFHSTGEDTDK